MGIKQIWDGKDLPPIGCQVLIKLASSGIKAYEVAGYGIRPPSASREPSIPEYYSIVVIKVKSLDGKAVNERFLSEVFPLDYREEAL